MNPMKKRIAVFWFRRDLRVEDNAGFYHALKSGLPVLPVFIFDPVILDKLSDKEDNRVTFIHHCVTELKNQLENSGSSLRIFYSKPLEVFRELAAEYNIGGVFVNNDYEPYSLKRDSEVAAYLKELDVLFLSFKDHVIFEKSEVLKDDGNPYTVFTPYSRKWKSLLNLEQIQSFPSESLLEECISCRPFPLPSLSDLGFLPGKSTIPPPVIPVSIIDNYGATRDIPSLNGTTRLGIHLRFGSISIRKLCVVAVDRSPVFLNELIWRDFFSSILWHFPYVAEGPFKKKYRFIEWRNDENEFKKWCNGNTGYPLVDAGMRELNITGFMHNRVRMVTASFLSKHLLIDWRWGEAYFAEKLLDFELASNNGNWQWAAGCGCDAAPYFRIFNPETQQKRFDPSGEYIKRWIPEAVTSGYPQPMVDHKFARDRALKTFRKAVG